MPALEGKLNNSIVNADSKGVLAMEIGSYFRDHGGIEESKKWTELSKHVGGWDRLHEGTRDDKAGRLLQHEVISLVPSSGNIDFEARFHSAQALMTRDYSPVGQTNADQWMLRRYQLFNDSKKAERKYRDLQDAQRSGKIERIEAGMAPGSGRLLIVYNHWTYIEQSLNFVDYLLRPGDKTEAEEFFVGTVIPQLLKTDIVPSTVACSQSLAKLWGKHKESGLIKRSVKDLKGFRRVAAKVYHALTI